MGGGRGTNCVKLSIEFETNMVIVDIYGPYSSILPFRNDWK